MACCCQDELGSKVACHSYHVELSAGDVMGLLRCLLFCLLRYCCVSEGLVSHSLSEGVVLGRNRLLGRLQGGHWQLFSVPVLSIVIALLNVLLGLFNTSLVSVVINLKST